MSPRVIYDTSAILSQMTPDPRDGSVIWQWMEDGVVQPVVSDSLIEELRRNLALPRFRLTRAAQNAIVADYLRYAEIVVSVPPSGAVCRGPDDVPVLDLDGDFNFRIVRPSGLYPLL